MRSSAMSVPLLALAHPDEPENSTTTRLFGVATRLADLLRRGQSIRRQEVKRLMEEAFSASDATGNWSMRDAYDALEAAQVILLKSPGNWTGIALAGADAFASLRRFERALPTQTYRSEHQVEMQQFSTPISLPWLSSQAARIPPSVPLLSPSSVPCLLSLPFLHLFFSCYSFSFLFFLFFFLF